MKNTNTTAITMNCNIRKKCFRFHTKTAIRLVIIDITNPVLTGRKTYFLRNIIHMILEKYFSLAGVPLYMHNTYKAKRYSTMYNAASFCILQTLASRFGTYNHKTQEVSQIQLFPQIPKTILTLIREQKQSVLFQ